MHLKKYFSLAIMSVASSIAISVPFSAEAAPAPALAQSQTATMWFVIFNQPDACVANPGAVEQCGDVDVFGQAYLDSVANGVPDPALIDPNDAAGVAVIHGTGAVTTRRGLLRLVSTLYRSEAGVALDLQGQPSLIDPLGLGRAFESRDAEVHLVVRSHGDAERGDVVAQVTSFLDPYCSDPTLLYFEGENLCADVQFAVFAPGEAGEDAVISVATGQPVTGARAILYRIGDAIQAVVETRVADED